MRLPRLRRRPRRPSRFDGDRHDVASDGRAPDATVDEVGAAKDNVGFDGSPLRSRGGSGHGSNDPIGQGWWGGGGGGPGGF